MIYQFASLTPFGIAGNQADPKQQIPDVVSRQSFPQARARQPYLHSIATTPSSSSLTYTIPRSLPQDALAISTLIGTIWAHFFAYSVAEADLEDYLRNRVSETDIRKEADDNGAKNYFLLACFPKDKNESGEGEEKVLGLVQLVRESTEPCLTLPKQVELQRLYVHSSQHGTGLAKELVKTAEAQAGELGGKNI